MYNPYEINHDLMTILPRVAAQYPGQVSMRKTINTVVKATEVFDDALAQMQPDVRRLIASYVLIDLMDLCDRYDAMVAKQADAQAAAVALTISEDMLRDRRLLDILSGCIDDAKHAMDPILISAIAEAISNYDGLIEEYRDNPYRRASYEAYVTNRRSLYEILQVYSANTSKMSTGDVDALAHMLYMSDQIGNIDTSVMQCLDLLRMQHHDNDNHDTTDEEEYI